MRQVVWSLSGPRWRARFPAGRRQQLLSHPQPIRFLSDQETQASLARPAAKRSRQREYTVDLYLTLGPGPHGNWNEGRNSRFVGLVHLDGGWRVDAIATSPGYVLCDGQGHCQSPTPQDN